MTKPKGILQFRVSFTKKLYPDVPALLAEIRRLNRLLQSDAQATYQALITLRNKLRRSKPLVDMANFNEKTGV